MKVALKPAARQFIDEQVKTGRFNSPEDVLDEAINRMMDDAGVALDEQSLAAIDKSEDQIERGQFRDWKKTSAQLRAKYLAR